MPCFAYRREALSTAEATPTRPGVSSGLPRPDVAPLLIGRSYRLYST